MSNARIPKSLVAFCHDVLAAQLALVFAVVLAHDGYLFRRDVVFLDDAVPLFVTLAGGAFLAFRLHRHVWSYTSNPELGAIAKAASVAIALFVVILVATGRAADAPPAVIIIQWFVLVVLLCASRLVYRMVKARSRTAGARQSARDVSVLLCGCAPIASLFIRTVQSMPESNVRVVGIIDDAPQRCGRHLHQVPILGQLRDLDRVLAELAVQGIYPRRLLVAGTDPALLAQAHEAAAGCQDRQALEIRHLPDMMSLRPVVAAPEADAGAVTPERLYFRCRHAFEVLLSAVMLLALAPLVAAIGLAVLVSLGRPVLFRQVRPGRYMRPFTLHKFRTMGAAYVDGTIAPDYQRTSTLGRFLRRSHLDELPQLFNVLRGDMSFIGPRPLLPRDLPDDGAKRFTVRPGITGWAQVNGGHKLSPAEKAALDAWYMRNRDVRLDLRILFLSLSTILFGEQVGFEAIRAAGVASSDKDLVRSTKSDAAGVHLVPPRRHGHADSETYAHSQVALEKGVQVGGSNRPPIPTHIFSIDVEDWFHILDLDSVPHVNMWARLPSRVEHNLLRLLDLLSAHDARATVFFVGWIAERFPHLVREARARGHGIGSHSYLHRLVTTMSPEDFAEDARRARGVLQDISGDPVAGYRAPGFSYTAETPWFLERLAEVGHTFDCSVFPGRHRHGGIGNAEKAPHIVFRPSAKNSGLVEVPASVVPLFGAPVCFFGGGYLRLFPTKLIKKMANQISASGYPAVFYIHPRDIDPEQPRLPMSPLRRFKCYVNVGTTYNKLDELLHTFRFCSVEEYLAASPIRLSRNAKNTAVHTAAPGVSVVRTEELITGTGALAQGGL